MKKFLKLFLMPLVLGIVALSTIALTSCGEKEIVDVKVNEDTVPTEIVQGTLDDEIVKIKLVVTLSDKSTYEVAVSKDMLSAKDLEKLADIGTYNVTVSYEGFNVEVRLVIVEAEDNVELTDITLTVAEPNVEVEYGAAHSALTGVSAVGNDGVSYASKVTYKITNKAGQEVASVDTYQELEVYTVVISISYNGINKSVTKTVTVGAKPDTSGNLIPSGEFPMENGAYTGWAVYSDQSTVTYESEVIGGTTFAKVVEDVVSGFSYSPRLNNTTGNYFKLYAGTTYKISFQAKALASKTILCQVGQLIGGAPYFYDFAGQQFQFSIGTEMATYSFTFNALSTEAGDLGSSSVTFELGTVGGDATATTIWLGNVVVEEFDGPIEDTLAPVINASNKTFFIGNQESIDLNSFISANDAIDGAVVPTYVIKNAAGEVVDEIDPTVVADYTVEITAEDAAGNVAKLSITVSVKEKSGSSNAFGVIEDVMNGGETDAPANPGKLLYWHVGDVSWNCGPVTSTTVTNVDGVLTFVNDQGENTNAWGIQAFYSIPELEEAGDYIFSAKINSTVAGDITIKIGSVVKVVTLAVGDNDVKFACPGLVSGTPYTFVILFGSQANGEQPIGSGTFVFSNLSLSLPANAFGVIEDVMNGGETDAPANPGKLLYWNVGDVSWNCGPVTSTTVTNVDGVLTFVNDQGENTNAWGIQAFYQIPELEEAGNYKFSAKINSTVAGDITIKIGSIVKVVTLAVGDNDVSFVCEGLASGTPYTFVILFGSQANGEQPIGSGTFVFSNLNLAVTMEEPVQPEPAPEVPGEVVESEVFEMEDVQLSAGEEGPLAAGEICYWADLGYVSSYVTVSSAAVTNNEITASYTSSGACEFGFQLFYKSAQLTKGATYTLSITVEVETLTRCMVNGQLITLVEGANTVNVDYVEGGDISSLDIQIGISADIAANTVKLSNISWALKA